MGDLISVIVPIYNVESYLRACIDSIIKQTHKNLEIILVDDGSPDNSGIICDEYAARDFRIKVIHQKNMGLSLARNAGMHMATGDYIAFVDSDDTLECCMYELLLKHMTMSGADIAQCSSVRTAEPTYSSENSLFFNASVNQLSWRDAVVDLLCSGSKFTCAVWNKLYTRQVIAGIDFIKIGSEDFIFHYELLKTKKPQIVYFDIPLYHYIKRLDSITTGKLKQLNIDFFYKLHEIESFEEDKEFIKYFKIQKAISARNIIVRQIVSNSFPEVFEDARRDMIAIRSMLFCNRINIKFKFQVILLWISPMLFKRYIRKKARRKSL